MKVKVIRSEIREGEKKDGTPYIGCSAVVIFPDGVTAAKIFISDEVIDPLEVQPGKVYDMYRDKNDFVLVFDKVESAQPAKQ